MSSHSTHSKIIAKQIELDDASSIAFVSSSDESNKVTLHMASEPTASAAYTLEAITADKAILHESSSLAGANLSAGSVATAALADSCVTAAKMDVAGATDISTAFDDADSILVNDSTDDSVKRLTGANLKNYIGTPSVADGSITSAKLAADCIDSSKLADDSVGAEHIIDDAVGAAALASDAVVTASIVDANVTSAKLAADCIDSSKLADDSVGAEHIIDDAVGAAALASDAVVTASIVDANVTMAKLADGATTAGTVGASELLQASAAKDLSGFRHLTSTGIVQTGLTGEFNFGGAGNGAFRMAIVSGDFVVQKRTGGVWVTKFTAAGA